MGSGTVSILAGDGAAGDFFDLLLLPLFLGLGVGLREGVVAVVGGGGGGGSGGGGDGKTCIGEDARPAAAATASIVAKSVSKLDIFLGGAVFFEDAVLGSDF